MAAPDLGAYSLDAQVRMAAGFLAGLAVGGAVWLVRRLLRRRAAKAAPWLGAAGSAGFQPAW